MTVRIIDGFDVACVDVVGASGLVVDDLDGDRCWWRRDDGCYDLFGLVIVLCLDLPLLLKEFLKPHLLMVDSVLKLHRGGGDDDLGHLGLVVLPCS